MTLAAISGEQLESQEFTTLDRKMLKLGQMQKYNSKC